MESLFMGWMLDPRWLFNLPNPCFEFALIVPATLNLATIIGMAYERSQQKIEQDSYSILLYSLWALQMVLCLVLMVRTSFLSNLKLKDAQENYQAIRCFVHTYQGKKGIWSWNGGCIFILSIVQIVINSLYIKVNSSQSGCVANTIRFYVDIVAWSYLCAVIAMFLICKVAFLLFAWKNPQRYLSYKQVI